MRICSDSLTRVVLFSILVAILSCKSKLTYLAKPASLKLRTIVLDSSIIVIPLNKNELSLYKIASVNDRGLFCGYNPAEHRLDLFSLMERKSLLHVPLKENGPNSIKKILSICILNTDSIFVLSRDQIVLFNSNGEILKSIPVNTKTSYFKDNYFTEYDYGSNFSYSTKDKRLFITNVSPNSDIASKKRFKTPFISMIDLESPNKINRLFVDYSILYLNNYYGFMVAPQFIRTIDEKTILFNFPIEPNIYKYDIASIETKVYGGIPPKIKGGTDYIAPPMNEGDSRNDDRKLLHYIESCNYYKVLPEKNGRGYFRIHSDPMKYINADGSVNDINQKKRFLTIYDSAFNLISTLDLNDRSYALPGAFTTLNGLYLPVTPANGNSLLFKVFKFKI